MVGNGNKRSKKKVYGDEENRKLYEEVIEAGRREAEVEGLRYTIRELEGEVKKLRASNELLEEENNGLRLYSQLRMHLTQFVESVTAIEGENEN